MSESCHEASDSSLGSMCPESSCDYGHDAHSPMSRVVQAVRCHICAALCLWKQSRWAVVFDKSHFILKNNERTQSNVVSAGWAHTCNTAREQVKKGAWVYTVWLQTANGYCDMTSMWRYLDEVIVESALTLKPDCILVTLQKHIFHTAFTDLVL